MFTDAATRLSGQSAMLFGWKPDDFWSATPAELGAVIAAMLPISASGLDRNTLDSLKGQFPDG